MTTTNPVPAVSIVSGPGGCWPTHLQELVLDAALGDRDQAGSAFAEWVAASGFDEIETGSFRVLPLVAHNLEQHGINTEWSQQLRGILRRSWYENQVMLHATLPAVDTLHAAGIDVVVLKGAALGVLAYPGIGVRPMDDLDVLVPEDQRGRCTPRPARRRLGTRRRAAAAARRRAPEPFLRFRHGAPLLGPGGFDLDLHWHAADAWCWHGADRGLWAATRTFELQGRRVRALGVGDDLLHTCVHGLHWNPIPPMRWVADAVTLMRSQHIAWPELVARARQLYVEPQLGLAFAYLVRRFDAPIPEWVIGALGERRAGYFERAWLGALLDRGETRTFAAQYGRYLRGASTDSGPLRWVGGLPAHLTYLLGCRAARELPVEITRRRDQAAPASPHRVPCVVRVLLLVAVRREPEVRP